MQHHHGAMGKATGKAAEVAREDLDLCEEDYLAQPNDKLPSKCPPAEPWAGVWRSAEAANEEGDPFPMALLILDPIAGGDSSIVGAHRRPEVVDQKELQGRRRAHDAHR